MDLNQLRQDIRQMLLNQNTQFNRSLQNNILRCIKSKEFYTQLEKLLKQRKIVFLRHAESQINLFKQNVKNFLGKYPQNPSLYDPSITVIGFNQCENFKDSTQYDVVYVSPALRTLQTYQNIELIAKKLVITHLIRQRNKDKAAVIGKSLQQLKIHFGHFDFSKIKQNYWWRFDYKPLYDEQLQKQSNENVEARLAFFFLWILLEEDKNIMLISHAIVYDIIHQSKYYETPNNVQPRQMKHDAIIRFFKRIQKRLVSKL